MLNILWITVCQLNYFLNAQYYKQIVYQKEFKFLMRTLDTPGSANMVTSVKNPINSFSVKELWFSVSLMDSRQNVCTKPDGSDQKEVIKYVNCLWMRFCELTVFQPYDRKEFMTIVNLTAMVHLKHSQVAQSFIIDFESKFYQILCHINILELILKTDENASRVCDLQHSYINTYKTLENVENQRSFFRWLIMVLQSKAGLEIEKKFRESYVENFVYPSDIELYKRQNGNSLVSFATVLSDIRRGDYDMARQEIDNNTVVELILKYINYNKDNESVCLTNTGSTSPILRCLFEYIMMIALSLVANMGPKMERDIIQKSIYMSPLIYDYNVASNTNAISKTSQLYRRVKAKVMNEYSGTILDNNLPIVCKIFNVYYLILTKETITRIHFHDILFILFKKVTPKIDNETKSFSYFPYAYTRYTDMNNIKILPSTLIRYTLNELRECSKSGRDQETNTAKTSSFSNTNISNSKKHVVVNFASEENFKLS